MKNFLILVCIFFLVFLLLTFLAPDSMFIFFYIYLGLLIAAICLLIYLGWQRGLVFLAAYAILPFLLEYLLGLFKLPFFGNSTILYLSTQSISLPATTANLILLFNIPALLICSLFFGQKLKLLLNIKKYPKTFLIIFSSLLFALNFLSISPQKFDYDSAIKWLVIAAILNLLLAGLLKFRGEIRDFFKELPIVLWLLLYAANYAITPNYYYFIITGLLLIIYLIALFNEHQYKKLNPSQ